MADDTATADDDDDVTEGSPAARRRRMTTTQYEDEPIHDRVLSLLCGLEEADKLDAEIIVSLAEDPASPLHPLLEWDDAEAAHQHRLQQARQLIARFKIIRIDHATGEEITVRRFTHVDSKGKWYDTDRAMRDWGEEILNRARKDLQRWKLRYDRLGRVAQLNLVQDVIGLEAPPEAPPEE
jgi:hypothetical protein